MQFTNRCSPNLKHETKLNSQLPICITDLKSNRAIGRIDSIAQEDISNHQITEKITSRNI
jgi:hypothetical protein